MKYLLILVPVFAMGSSPETPRAGKILYMENCVSCHGVAGRGDGPLAAALDTPPADLTGIAARRNGVWPMLEVMSILDGYSRKKRPQEDMPIIDEILDNEMSEFDTGNGVITLIPTKLIEIASYLETLQDPAPTRHAP